jgi:hypothetical protein
MEEKKVTVTGQLPTGYKPEAGVTYTDSMGVPHTGTEWEPVEGETYSYTTTMLVPKSKGKSSFTKSAETIGGKKGKVNKDGGSKEKADKIKKSDIVQRYKEVDDALEKIADTMEDTSKIMDRLYGASRLK